MPELLLPGVLLLVVEQPTLHAEGASDIYFS